MGDDLDPLHLDPAEPTTLVLLARSAFAASPYREMRTLCERVAARTGASGVTYAFSEQGTPSLRDRLIAFGGEGVTRIVVVPLILPMEPAFRLSLLRSLSRWQAEAGGRWPSVLVARQALAGEEIVDLVAAMVARAVPVETARPSRPREGSLVPAQERRVLVCHGGPCTQAGAAAVWVHLRNEQERLGLRDRSPGTMTAKSTCLGPCNLGPVLQVFPEGTYYGGVDEAVLDEIVSTHLVNGRVAAHHAYPPTGRKQRLRAAASHATTHGDPTCP